MRSINRVELACRFAESLERERVNLGYTQAQMADALSMSVSNYKKLVLHETVKIDMIYAIRLHELTGWRIDDLYEDAIEIDAMRAFRSLSYAQQQFIIGVAESLSRLR